MYYIYEIVNLLGTVEYVGETNNPKLRFINHKCKNGLFYKRQDILMNVLNETFETKKEAFYRQIELQKEYNIITDLDKCSAGGKACNNIEKNKKHIKKLGLKWGIISSKKIHTCSKCGKYSRLLKIIYHLYILIYYHYQPWLPFELPYCYQIYLMFYLNFYLFDKFFYTYQNDIYKN